MLDDSLTDRIYEAAFNPEQWVPAVDKIAVSAGAASGCVTLVRGTEVLGIRASADLRSFNSEFVGDPATQNLFGYAFAHYQPGFVRARKVLPHSLLEASLAWQLKRKHGFDDEAFTLIPMPGGDIAMFSFDRLARNGSYRTQDMQRLDALRPHLARAAMVSARLRLEQARMAVGTLEALGIPAAVLAGDGRVRASNALLETVADQLMPAAFGSITLAANPANDLFQKAISLARTADGSVRSIPVPAKDERAPIIVHVLPLRRSAYDIFSGSDVLVAVSEIALDKGPPVNLLIGLFDLSPAEARLAAALVAGNSLKQAAGLQKIQTTTARAYLSEVFRKTGTHGQSQLIALLKGARSY